MDDPTSAPSYARGGIVTGSQLVVGSGLVIHHAIMPSDHSAPPPAEVTISLSPTTRLNDDIAAAAIRRAHRP